MFKDAFSQEVWETKYRDKHDHTIEDTFRRVADAMASVEENPSLWKKRFYDMLSDFKVVPGGRIISNAGTEWKGTTLINCFVAPRTPGNLDSIEGIANNQLKQQLTLKSEGGWGENFSYIRPRGTFIHGVGVDSPGAVKFMEGFDKGSEIVTSGSGLAPSRSDAKKAIRKGAMMGVMDVWHPDIIEFITAKQTPGRLSKFNMSVNCTDEFMEKVIAAKDYLSDPENTREMADEQYSWTFKFPDTKHPKYDKEWDGDILKWEGNGYTVNEYRTIPVLHMWDLVMQSTYNRAEPGILWLDRANYFNPLKYFEKIFATNPCGEQTLAPAGVCCLSSINLTQFVTEEGEFDFAKFKKYLKVATRFLDNVNSYSVAPLPEYKNSMENKRRIGVGLMGWGSLLMMLQMRFGSDEALSLQDELVKIYARTVYETSIDLAEEKGMFKYCDPKKHAESPFITGLGLSPKYMEKLRTTGIRNSACLSIQPTGNTGIYANMVSGGIEPVFLPEYIRTASIGETPDEIAHLTPKWHEGEFVETSMFKMVKEGDEDILRGEYNGTVYKIDRSRGLTKEVQCMDYGVRYAKEKGFYRKNAAWLKSTEDLTVQDHVNDLKGWAKYVDSAISKTVNLPYEYSFAEFEDLYLEAYKTGYIKGLTSYRSGTMTSVLSAMDKGEEEIIMDDVKLPDSAPAMIKTFRAEKKKWYLTVNFWDTDNSRPFAMFVKTNNREPTASTEEATEKLLVLAETKGIKPEHIKAVRAKIENDSNPDKLARAISFNLRHGVLVKNVVNALEEVDIIVGSFLFHIKKYLGTFIKDGEKVDNESCQECGNGLHFQEGCVVCSSCGWTKC